MNKGGKIGLVVVLFVLLGVGGYYGYQLLYKPKEEEEEEEIILTDPKKDGGGGGGSTKNYTFPFKTTDEGNKFRAYVNTKYPSYAKEIDLDLTGALNSFVEKAWLKYGAEYKKQSSGSNSGTPPKKTPTKASASQIAQIQAFADKNDRTTESYLKSANQDYVKIWASSITNDKTAFVWANQVYRTKTGGKVLTYNPLATTFYANKTGAILRSSPSNSSTYTSSVTKNDNLGKGGAIEFADGYLYIYLPSKKYWIASIYVSQYKVAFTGETEFENFRGFSDDY